MITNTIKLGVHTSGFPHATNDNFDENYIDYALWETYNSSDPSEVIVANGQLQISHTANSQYNTLQSLDTWDLTGDAFSVQVTDAGNQALSSHGAFFGILIDANNKVSMGASNGMLQPYQVVAGVQTGIGSGITYNSVTHAYWRIRESGGTLFCDTSTDGTSWTNRWSLLNPFAITAVYGYCQSGCWQNEASGSHAYFDNFVFPSNISTLTTFTNDAGRKPSIVMVFQAWGDAGKNFLTGSMNFITAFGAIPMVTWEPWVSGGVVTQPTYSLANIIAGNFDTYITSFATSAATWGKPFYLRFAHEMNGNWYPWSEQVNGNSSGQYVTAWRHIHALFVAAGATNVIWVWAPNTEYSGSTALSELYPGDNYVDWIGMDGYNWGTSQTWSSWQSFSQVFNQTYTTILNVTSTKPLMIAEMSSSESGGSKADWITSVFPGEISKFPRIQAFIWFNQTTGSDWRIESSNSAITAFKVAMQKMLQGASFNDTVQTRRNVQNLQRF